MAIVVLAACGIAVFSYWVLIRSRKRSAGTNSGSTSTASGVSTRAESRPPQVPTGSEELVDGSTVIEEHEHPVDIGGSESIESTDGASGHPRDSVTGDGSHIGSSTEQDRPASPPTVGSGSVAGDVATHTRDDSLLSESEIGEEFGVDEEPLLPDSELTPDSSGPTAPGAADHTVLSPSEVLPDPLGSADTSGADAHVDKKESEPDRATPPPPTAEAAGPTPRDSKPSPATEPHSGGEGQPESEPDGPKVVQPSASPARQDGEETPPEPALPTPEQIDLEPIPARNESESGPEPEQSRAEPPGPSAPVKYKGLNRSAPTGPPKKRRMAPAANATAEKRRSYPIEVRLLFGRDGFCNVSLVFRRSAEAPEELTVHSNGETIDLCALQDEWYQDVYPEPVGPLLQDGVRWRYANRGETYTWQLAGRELYVLADRTDLRGYVSQPALELGREHLVMCTKDVKAAVEQLLQETGAAPREVLDESRGVPPGWCVLTGVVPCTPVSPNDGADVMNALRPLPRIDITLKGGIRIERTGWLEGYPPSIQVHGESGHAPEVTIDGQTATASAEGGFRVPGWDALGSHSVWCGGVTKTYSIVAFAPSWGNFPAYSFPIAQSRDRLLRVCGPLVGESLDQGAEGAESILVPSTNRVAIGPTPGQFVIAARTSLARDASCFASPPFEPSWLLPTNPLRCDKARIRIRAMGQARPPQPDHTRLTVQRKDRDAVECWCRIILDACRKGLLVDPDTESTRESWRAYRDLARNIWRSMR